VILSFSDVPDSDEGLRWGVETRNWDVLPYDRTEEACDLQRVKCRHVVLRIVKIDTPLDICKRYYLYRVRQANFLFYMNIFIYEYVHLVAIFVNIFT
jgi:hypothetical protein